MSAALLALKMDEALSDPATRDHVAAAVDLIAPGLLESGHLAAAAASQVFTDAAHAAQTSPINFAPPDPIRLQMFAAIAGYITGDTATCVCVPAPSNPEPIMAAAWKPGLITCMRHAPLLALPPGSAEDLRCDLCGDEGRASGLMCQAGLLLFQWGECPDCFAGHGYPGR